MDSKTVSVGYQAWILAFAITVCVVKGDYVVMVRTHNFSNSGSLLANENCCDFRNGECQVPGCDNRFVYCLRRNANSNNENCEVSQTNWNDAPLNFLAQTLLGLPNPLPLRGLTREWNATQGVYFNLVVLERDGTSSESFANGGLVINVFEPLHLQVGDETSLITFNYEDNMRAMITLSFRVVCAENYYGPNCFQFCRDNCGCDPGFTGEFCQTNIDECVGVNCSGNGVCLDGVNSFTCQCNPGFNGTLCSEELQSSGVQTGPIVGGVLGALISLILILIIIVVAVILTMRCLNRQGKGEIQGRTAHSDALPGDNPVYDRGDTAVTLGAHTSAPVNLSSSDKANMIGHGSAPDRVFDNPIYGGNDEETDNMYADPDTNHHAGTRMGSAPYHDFDNPIYSGESDENAYSLLTDSSTANGLAASTGQTL